jgi:hypothetical protein
LVGVVEGLSVGASEQQQPAAAILAVDGAHVQRGVARGVSRVHVGPVEQQVLQMLHQAVTTRLKCHQSKRSPTSIFLFYVSAPSSPNYKKSVWFRNVKSSNPLFTFCSAVIPNETQQPNSGIFAKFLHCLRVLLPILTFSNNKNYMIIWKIFTELA